MNTIFKENDTVYTLNSQSGKILRVEHSGVTVKWNPETNAEWFPMDTALKWLSFTPYDLIHGGFSQERPKPIIEKGTVIYFKHRDNSNTFWCISKVNRMEGDIPIVETANQHIVKLHDNSYEYSLENPLK